MGISSPNSKRLWARSGNQCAYPECYRQLTADMETYVKSAGHTEFVTLGEEAHIIAKNTNGPRGADRDLSPKELDSYDNLILLCEEHHELIDSYNGRHWPVDSLLKMKRDHEHRSLATPSRLLRPEKAKQWNALLSSLPNGKNLLTWIDGTSRRLIFWTLHR